MKALKKTAKPTLPIILYGGRFAMEILKKPLFFQMITVLVLL